MSEYAHVSGVWFEQACGQLKNERFTGSGLADKHFRFARLNLEGDATEDLALAEAKVNVLKRNDGLARGAA